MTRNAWDVKAMMFIGLSGSLPVMIGAVMLTIMLVTGDYAMWIGVALVFGSSLILPVILLVVLPWRIELDRSSLRVYVFMGMIPYTLSIEQIESMERRSAQNFSYALLFCIHLSTALSMDKTVVVRAAKGMGLTLSPADVDGLIDAFHRARMGEDV